MLLEHGLEINLLEIFNIDWNVSYKIFIILHHELYNFDSLDERDIGIMQILFDKIALVLILNFDKAKDKENDSDYGSKDPEEHLVLFNPANWNYLLFDNFRLFHIEKVFIGGDA